MSVHWSLAENAASLGGGPADDGQFPGPPGEQAGAAQGQATED